MNTPNRPTLGIASAPAQGDTADFLDATTAINLRRIWIVSLVGIALTGVVFVINLLLVKWNKVTQVAASDLALSFLMIASVAAIRRRPRRGWWPRLFVLGFALVWLGMMDAYYFSAFAAGTHNASYAIGVMGAAVFLLLPPAISLAMFAVNHAVYCAILLTWPGRKVAAPLMDGTVSVAVGAVASWLLFHAVRENFSKERIIVERNRALAASNAELRELMAIAAHDLRSPLLGLRDLLGLARREPAAETSRLARVLDLAADSCGAMVRLVSRLVEAHAAEETGGTLALVPQDLRESCTAAVDRLHSTAEAKQQRIALALPPAAAIARADAATLGQILENLLGNALKFSPRDSVIEVSLEVTDGIWRIAVRDEGPGVPPEERDTLFRKFQRGSARPTGGESSTGLGLHIAKTLSEAMGGRVSHAPREPHGSVFCLELPRA